MVNTTQAALLGIVMVFIAFAVPVFVGATEDRTAERTKLITEGVGDTVQIEDLFSVTLTSKSGGVVELEYTSIRTANTTNTTISETETATVSLDNQTITTTVVDVVAGTGGDVTLRILYPNDFDWSPASKGLSDNAPILFVLIPIAILAAFIAKVMS